MVSPSGSLPKADILTTVLLESAVPSSNPQIFQRSPDGQFLAVTSKIISITTPQPFFASSAVVGGGLAGPIRQTYLSAWSAYGHGRPRPPTEGAAAEKEETEGGALDPMPSFTTKIKLPPPGEFIEWVEHSTDDRVINLGGQFHQTEILWRGACWSPSGASSLGGCVLAAVNSNLEAYIYAPSKDPLTGEWVQVDYLTEKLLKVTDFPEGREQNRSELASWEGMDQWNVQRVMDCQVLCMAWSPQVSGGKLSGRSLLALGHKAGSITFWSIGADQKMTCLHKARLGDRFISSLAFSDWNYTSPTTASVPLVYTTPSGVTTLLRISLDASDSSTLSLDEGTVLRPADNRPLTSLAWAPSDRQLLVYTQPGKVTIWSPSVEEGKRGWEGERTVLLAKMGDWVGCSKLSGCAAINSYTSTSVVLTLIDGTFHLIEALDTPEPSYNIAVSRYLSNTARAAFEDVESNRVKMTLVRTAMSETTMRCSGAIYLGRGLWSWLHQPVASHDISYLIPSGQSSTIVTAEIATHSQPQRATQLKEIREALDSITNNFDISTPALLAPFFATFMSNLPASATSFKLLSPHLLRAVRQLPSTETDLPSVMSQSECPEKLKDVKAWFAKGLKEDLWERASLVKLRVRYALARYLSTFEGPQQEEFAAQSQLLSRLVVTESLGIILDWANKTKEFITGANDLSYLTLLIHALLSLYLRPSLPSSTALPSQPSASSLITLSNKAGKAFDLALHFDPPLAIAVDPEELEELIQHATIPPPQLASTATGGGGMEEDQEEEEAPVVVGWEAARQGLGSWLGGGGGEVFESCPGCEEEVRLEELEVGVCKEEHVFDRCSLTLSVISAPQSRKCLTCARPALLPKSFPVKLKSRKSEKRKSEDQEEDEDEEGEGEDRDVEMVAVEEEEEEEEGEGAGKDWLRDAVLEVGKVCLYCGGRFALAM
ncbi:hypothetical protein BDY24DRAFT_443614 [Mrakia frigida]|uniref:uncharacterized protein n=1 Tax=Mrakia frigida TaxID=29902 RepID=UPI003FCC1789